MKEFIEVGKKLPKEGRLVDIKLSTGIIIRRVLFSEGRFWKNRTGKGIGQTWAAISWAPLFAEGGIITNTPIMTGDHGTKEAVISLDKDIVININSKEINGAKKKLKKSME